MLPSSLKSRNLLILLIFFAGLSAGSWTLVQAQTQTQTPTQTPAWQPSKPLRMVVPFPAGGTGDVLMRTVAEPLSALWKQPVLVENRAGAGTVIATDYVSKQPGDGSVWLQVAGSFVSNAIVRPKLPYDPVRDFTPVVLLANSPVVLAVNSNLGAKTVQELIALARSKPGELSIATIGPATTQHILVEMLKLAGKVNIVYTSFNGGAASVTAAAGGHVSGVIANYSEVAPQVSGGKLRAMAVGERSRIDLMPEVPTIAESGYSDIYGSVWFGLVAPSATPREAVLAMQTELARILGSADVRRKLLAQGLYPAAGSSEDFAAHLRLESARFGKVIAAAGIKAE